MFQVKAKILPHPRLENGVEVHVVKNGFIVESFSAVLHSLEDSIAHARKIVRNMFPSLTEGDIDVHVPSGIERD